MMESNNFTEQLKSENEWLQIQLQDLNEMIKVREEELEVLRQIAVKAVELQSQLDLNLDQFYQMQDVIGSEQNKVEGSEKRAIQMENELLQSIEMETELYNLRDQFQSARSAVTDIKIEMDAMATVYKDNANLKSRIAELESNLEIADMENKFLKEELDSFQQNSDSLP